MAVVKMYDQDKKEAGEITLAPEVFEVEVRPEILNLVVRAYRAALRAGTHAVKTRALMVVKSIALPEAKTKHFAKVAGTLGLSKALVVASPEDGAEGGALALSARNIPGIKLVTPDAVNVYEVLNHKQIVVLEGALPHLEARLK